MRHIRDVALVTVVLATVAACGGDDDTTAAGDGTSSARTVEVEMVDIAFEPDALEVRSGETVRFVFTNQGEMPHDAFIGDEEAQADHEAEMRESDEGHGGGHGTDDEENAVTVEPGDTAELTYTFERGATVEIGCHQPGHYDAGMTIEVDLA